MIFNVVHWMLQECYASVPLRSQHTSRNNYILISGSHGWHETVSIVSERVKEGQWQQANSAMVCH